MQLLLYWNKSRKQYYSILRIGPILVNIFRGHAISYDFDIERETFTDFP